MTLSAPSRLERCAFLLVCRCHALLDRNSWRAQNRVTKIGHKPLDEKELVLVSEREGYRFSPPCCCGKLVRTESLTPQSRQQSATPTPNGLVTSKGAEKHIAISPSPIPRQVAWKFKIHTCEARRSATITNGLPSSNPLSAMPAPTSSSTRLIWQTHSTPCVGEQQAVTPTSPMEGPPPPSHAACAYVAL